MCSEFDNGEVARPDSLFKFIVADTHELVYREVFAFVHGLHSASHFHEKRVKIGPQLIFHREIFDYWLVSHACRSGATVAHVILHGTYNRSLEYFIN